MKVFLTGATGYIGTNVLDKLYQAGHEIHFLALPKEKTDHLKKYKPIIHRGNILDYDFTIFKKEEFNYVVHLANIRGNSHLNVLGTENLIRGIKYSEQKPKIIYTSSVMAVGPSGGIPHHEEVDLNPITPYGVSKVKSEKLIIESNVPYTILRSTAVIGNNNPTSKQIIKLLNIGYIISIKGAENQKISFIHVDDVVEAIFKSINHKGSENNIFNLSADMIMSPVEIIKTAATLLNKKINIITVPNWVARSLKTTLKTGYKLSNAEVFRDLLNAIDYQIVTANYSFVCDNSKIKKLLDWSPKKNDFTESIRSMLLNS